jgi:hypothetical protein
MTEDAHGSGNIEAFGQGRQYFAAAVGWGFETVQRRVSSCRKLAATGMAANVLDTFILAVRAITDEGVNAGIGDPAIATLGVSAGASLGIDLFTVTAAALDVVPGRWRVSWRGRRRLCMTEGAVVRGART